MDQNWERWIHASLSKFFKTKIETSKGLALYVEAQEEKIPSKNEPDWSEFRWDGPLIREWCKGLWNLDVEINILVSSIIGRTETHLHKKAVGIVQVAYENTIPVYRYGDDNTLLGCFQLKVDDREAIVTSYFGKIDLDVTLEQSTVEAHYRMQLKE